ncbi:hypothetical protein AB0467_30340 [Streptomyces sp. NPDC052095]|uniref:hypothetical protein n=1 Tax=unclassified Streptomyces TaxID=2593676 RepID=UPI00344D192C
MINHTAVEVLDVTEDEGRGPGNPAATPFPTLAPATLDALDAVGDVRYYAEVGEGFPRSRPRGIVRRRVDGDRTYDEFFTRGLGWKPAEEHRPHGPGHGDIDRVESTGIEAAAYIEAQAWRRRRVRPRDPPLVYVA